MQSIALEFARESGSLAAFGTDTITYLDGRWSPATQRAHIYARVAELRKLRGSAYTSVRFVGYSILGHSDYSTRHPHVRMPDLAHTHQLERHQPWTATPTEP